MFIWIIISWGTEIVVSFETQSGFFTWRNWEEPQCNLGQESRSSGSGFDIRFSEYEAIALHTPLATFWLSTFISVYSITIFSSRIDWSVDRYNEAGPSWIWILIEDKRFIFSAKHPDQSGTDSACFVSGTGLLYGGRGGGGVTRPGREANHSPTNRPSSTVFLNRRAAARYRDLASIIPGRERFSWNLSF